MHHPPLPSRADCPPLQRVAALQNGRLSAGEITLLEDHVAACPHCGELLDDLEAPSDALLRALAALPSSPDDELEFQRLQTSLLTATWSQDSPGRSAPRLADPPIGPLPQSLGNYELLECIGRGAWGAVFRARHRTLDQTVAVKVLDSSRWPNAAYLERFIQEAKASGQLGHDNMVRATDAGEDRGLHYLVMEYVDGVDAARLLKVTGPLVDADACEIVRQAAAALDFAHRRGWVHRDVKPSNLMITPAGTVKLLDLGIAGRRDEVNGSHATNERPMGTAGYMAPEQWTDFAAVDARADVYSLGCTLFKLLTGHAPSDDSGTPSSPSPPEGPPPSVAACRVGVPRKLDRLVQRMLAPQIHQRMQSAADAADALAPWTRRSDLRRLVVQQYGYQAAVEPATATAADAAGPESPRISRRRLIAGGAVAAAGAAMALPWWFLPRRSQLRRREWRPLVPTPPEILLAVDSNHKVQVETDELNRIVLRSEGLLLVHLGRAVSGVFALRVNLRQNGLPRGAGLFFRYTWKEDRPVCEFQSVELRPPDDSAAMNSAQLLWSKCTAASDGGRLQIEREPWAETAVDLADRGAGQSLEVVLGRSGFPKVRWNGRLLPQAKWTLSTEGRRQVSFAPDQLSRQYVGRLGLLSAGGETTFSTPQLAYL